MNRIIEGHQIRTGLFVLASVWLFWIAGKFGLQVEQLPQGLLEATLLNLKDLFLSQFIVFTVVLASYTLSPLDRFRGKILVAFFIISTIYVISIPGLWEFASGFFGFVFWILLASMTVRFLLRLISPRISTWGLSAGILIASLIPVWFFLGLAGILNIWTVGFVCVLLVTPGLWLTKHELPCLFRSLDKTLGRLDPVGFASLELLFILLTIAFIWTFSPEAGSDSARSHLPLARSIASSGSISQYFVSWGHFMPKAAQTWSAAAIIIGGFQLSKWLSWMYLVLAGLLIQEEMFHRTKNQSFSIMSTAVILSCPFLIYLSTTLYIDHFILLLNLTALILVFRSQGPNQISILMLSALVMGGLVQVKYNTLFFGIIWSSVVALYLFKSLGIWKALKWGSAIAVVFLASACPWYIFTYWSTGNPLFPYLNQVFQSPLWPSGVETTLGQDKYILGDDIFSLISFPWTITFLTSQFSVRPNGFMGYWMLGLLPFGLFGLSKTWFKRSLGLTLTGVAGIILICMVTLNIRYWLPAYPLVMCGILLGAYDLYEKIQIRLNTDVKMLAGLILMVMVILTIPFWTGFNHLGLWTWEVYSGQKSKSEWSRFMHLGTPAVEALNRIVQEDDGVLCTNYEAVYAVNARSYDFPFWHTNILDLQSGDDFAEFVNKNRIQYWLINLRSTDDNHFFNGRVDTRNRYFTDDRLVSASHQVAIFDVSESPRHNRLQEYEKLNPELVLCEPATPDCSDWLYSNPTDGKTVTVQEEGKITVPADGNILKVFEIPENSSMVEFTIRTTSNDSTTLILSLEWLDSDRKQFDKIQGGISSRLKYDLFKGPIYGNIPPDAEFVRIRIRPWRTTVSIFDPQIRFLGYSDKSEELTEKLISDE